MVYVLDILNHKTNTNQRFNIGFPHISTIRSHLIYAQCYLNLSGFRDPSHIMTGRKC